MRFRCKNHQPVAHFCRLPKCGRALLGTLVAVAVLSTSPPRTSTTSTVTLLQCLPACSASLRAAVLLASASPAPHARGRAMPSEHFQAFEVDLQTPCLEPGISGCLGFLCKTHLVRNREKTSVKASPQTQRKKLAASCCRIFIYVSNKTTCFVVVAIFVAEQRRVAPACTTRRISSSSGMLFMPSWVKSCLLQRCNHARIGKGAEKRFFSIVFLWFSVGFAAFLQFSVGFTS